MFPLELLNKNRMRFSISWSSFFIFALAITVVGDVDVGDGDVVDVVEKTETQWRRRGSTTENRMRQGSMRRQRRIFLLGIKHQLMHMYSWRL